MNRETAGEWEPFAEHRTRMTALISEAVAALAAARGAEAERTLALLGAGNCNDVELPALAAAFSAVHLLDLDRGALERARERQPAEVAARVSLHGPVDLGGGLPQLAGWKKRSLSPHELGALPGQLSGEALAAVPVRADVVVSACLLSQIVHTCHRVLGDEHPQLEAIACALVVAHVRTLVGLVQPGGIGILATDTVTSDTYPLEDLWGTRPPQALLDELEASGNHLSGTTPSFLRRILRTDEVLAKLVSGLRVSEPWLWRLTPTKTLLAYGLTFERRP